MNITIHDIDMDKLVRLKQQQKMHYATTASTSLDVEHAKIDLDNAVNQLRALEDRVEQDAQSRHPQPPGVFDAKLELARINEASARQCWQAIQSSRDEHGRQSGLLTGLLRNISEALKEHKLILDLLDDYR